MIIIVLLHLSCLDADIKFDAFFFNVFVSGSYVVSINAIVLSSILITKSTSFPLWFCQ